MEDILKVKSIYIILNTPVTPFSMSGGDKIFIKISELLVKNFNFDVTFVGCPDGINLVKNSTSVNFNYILINNITGENKNILLTYFLRLLFLYRVLFVRLNPNSVVISASDFITDTFPLFLLKIKYSKKAKFFTSMFLKKSLGDSLNFKDILYFISQQLTLRISKLLKFKILTNLIDLKYVCSFGIDKSKVIILPGGIDNIFIEGNKKIYDACFVGRISHQKGIDTLLDIWEVVSKNQPSLKLALVTSGNSSELENLRKEIKERNLSNNIISLGFLDNKEKYRVISNSKMLLFPSRFESFGIVVAESLNFGIPVIAFDLEALKLNFDEGILFSKNKEEFIKNIFTILEYPSIAEKIGNSGKSFVKKYSWEKIVKNFVDNLV